MEGSITRASAAYWDANREKARDPDFWMAHPLCRAAINRRVSGSPDEWPLDWFRRVHVQRPFHRGVSFGCGLGAFERSAIRAGIVREIDAFDVSARSLEEARELARREGIDGISYRIGDLDDPSLAPQRYDIAFFHASLHHVSRLERLFARLTRALDPGGAIYTDEYVGPSRDRWRGEDLAVARALLNLLPSEAKRCGELLPPIEVNDPSEAVRSQEIPEFLQRHFEMVDWRPYGGQLVDLLFPCLQPQWLATAEGERAVRGLLDLEEDQIDRDPDRSHHLVAYGRLRERRRAGLRFLHRLTGCPR